MSEEQEVSGFPFHGLDEAGLRAKLLDPRGWPPARVRKGHELLARADLERKASAQRALEDASTRQREWPPWEKVTIGIGVAVLALTLLSWIY
jgi:hypothetical protein